VEQDYPLAWRRRAARRRIALRLLLLAAALLLSGAAGLLRHADWAAIPLALLFPVLLMANLVWVWSLFFRCPRCGHPFTVARQPRAAGNPFAKRCLTCGLPLRAPRRTPRPSGRL
jgi:hypothetical protein